MKRRGSFDRSDYAFSVLVQDTGQVLRDSADPLDLETLARLVGRASHLPGDALRAAYQIEGHEDRDRGWQLLTIEALRVLKRARAVRERDGRYEWTRKGKTVVWVGDGGKGKMPIYSAEERHTREVESERRFRLSPNPFTDHHIKTNHPLIKPGQDNLPGRIYDPNHSDTKELRESLLTFGYVPQHPVLVDEFGTVLVGNTRERICAELREEFPDRTDLVPTRMTLTLGNGPEANAERLKIALTSNTGGRNLSTETKREVARYLYDEREWTYERIGEALNVSEPTARRMAAQARDGKKPQRAGSGTPTSYVETPEWQEVADPLIRDWINGEIPNGNEVIAALKARGLKANWSTIAERKRQLEAEEERSVSVPVTVTETETPLENTAPEVPDSAESEELESELEISSTERLCRAVRAVIESAYGDRSDEHTEETVLLSRKALVELERALANFNEHQLAV